VRFRFVPFTLHGLRGVNGMQASSMRHSPGHPLLNRVWQEILARGGGYYFGGAGLTRPTASVLGTIVISSSTVHRPADLTMVFTSLGCE